MGITAISRDYGVEPSIVRILTTDDLTAITTNGYLLTQESNINDILKGDFQWSLTDYVLIDYSGGQGFFTRDPIGNKFVAEVIPGGLSSTLSHNDIFVGNASNVATGVPVSGDISIDDTGLVTIANSAITDVKIANATITGDKLVPGSITSDQLSDGLVHYVSVPVSSAQFLNLSIANVLLIPQPGANKLIMVHDWTLILFWGTTQYQNGGDVGLEYNVPLGIPNTGDAIADHIVAGSINSQIANQVFPRGVLIGDYDFDLSTSINNGIYFSQQGPAFTNGDSSFLVNVWYSIISTV